MVGGAPIQGHWRPATSRPRRPWPSTWPRRLKAKGFKFCGPVIVYAFMEATGLVNDHLTTCFRHEECKAMAKRV
jgi:DNA-3-methyladenine glycosylase I